MHGKQRQSRTSHASAATIDVTDRTMSSAMEAPGKHLDSIEPGTWIVGVSGGADSVALLRLLVQHRPDVKPIVTHVDHQMRSDESDADAAFVQALARQLQLQFEVGLRHRLDPSIDESTSNLAARLRSMRQRFFIDLSERFGASGVLLAHHADDRAETVLLRLLRGGEAMALAGISQKMILGKTIFERPLLNVRRIELERFLKSINQAWRDDSSNRSLKSPRARVRSLLSSHPDWTDALLKIADGASALRQMINPPPLDDSFQLASLANLPDIIARRAARRWMMNHGARPDVLTSKVVSQLIEMSRDRATPARQSFSGGLLVERARGWIRCRKR